MSRLVFDVGGTTIRVAEATKHGVISVHRGSTPQDPGEVVLLLQRLIETLSTEEITEAVGGIAGEIVNGEAVRSSPNLPAWSMVPIGPILAEELHAPVRIYNDAQLACLGESLYGAGKGHSVVLYVGLGTGVGMSRCINGVIDESFNTETSHSIIDAEIGGSLENNVGGKSLEEQNGITPKLLPANTWIELSPVLARGIAYVLRPHEKTCVVLGGSLMNEDNGFQLGVVRTELLKCLPEGVTAEIHKGTLADTSALWGAKDAPL